MKIRTLVTACLAASAIVSMANEENEKPTINSKIEVLLLGLADENFQVREQSSNALWALGQAAIPALQDAIKSGDPEQAIRAQDLLRKIQMHVTPETDDSILSIVENYHTAKPRQKGNLMTQLSEKRAWRQILKLYAEETDQELRERLQPRMGAVAIWAARECLAREDAVGALEFLEMAPANAANLLTLADFHRSQGTLDRELEKASAGADRKAAAWRFALLRAAGKPAEASQQALAAGEKNLACIMSALAGDPLPFLRQARDNDSDSPANTYVLLASKRWQGEPVRKEQLKPLISLLAERHSSEQAGAIVALFLLGKTDLVEPTFTKDQLLNAFQFYDALEDIPKALGTLGIDPTKPNFAEWIDKKFKLLAKADIADQHEASDDLEQVLTLANFLERRGLHDEALAAFKPHLLALADKQPEVFKDYMGRLYGGRETLSGAPRLATAIGRAWAGGDKDRWDSLRIAALGDNERLNQWYDLLTEVDPKASNSEMLDAMMALGGLNRDPNGLRSIWMKKILNHIGKTAPDRRIADLEMLYELATEGGDNAICLKVWSELPPEARDKIFWGSQIMMLSAAERWNDAAEVVLKHIKKITDGKTEPSPDVHAYAAATLRAAGREKEAAVHDRWADIMALGNPVTALHAGNAYALARDYQRARAWWARAAIQADPESEQLTAIMKSHADALLEQSRWQEAAAVSEMLAALFAGTDYQWANPLMLMRQRLQADMCRALALLGENRKLSLEILDQCHRIFANDGSLADFFFPSLRQVGLIREHDKWFLDSWNRMQEVIKAYPNSDNTRNTAAWFAARAVRKLDEAEAHSHAALAASPNQSAYLDTMAEIYFARGFRDQALTWSAKAVNASPEDSMLRRQHARFLSDPLPK